jgi:hemolysin activation/secretion protein
MGGYPAQFAAAIGGRRSLRGYSFHRFAGDAAAYGGTELRVPVGTVNFIVRSQLGLFALADAGRVWFDGASNGGWHAGAGGGFWLAALGRSVSVAYAHGEGGKLYLSSGLFY